MTDLTIPNTDLERARELEPCPLCAGEARLMEGRGDWDRLDTRPRKNVWWAHCWSCGLKSGEHQTAAKATKAWNTRLTTLPQSDEPTEASLADEVRDIAEDDRYSNDMLGITVRNWFHRERAMQEARDKTGEG